jgi:hypothetical protein
VGPASRVTGADSGKGVPVTNRSGRSRGYDRAWVGFFGFGALLVVFVSSCLAWLDGSFPQWVSPELSFYLEAHWWFGTLIGLFFLHIAGLVLIALDRHRSTTWRTIWVLAALFLTFPIFVIYWFLFVRARHSASP